MGLPILPLEPPGVTQPVRGVGWNFKRSIGEDTIVQQSSNKYRLAVPLQLNPLWKWDATYEVLIDDPSKIKTANIPYTDFQVLQSFYVMLRGPYGVFLFRPPDSVQNIAGGAQTLLPPDGLGNTELTHTIGGVPAPYSGTGSTIAVTESVQELNGGVPAIYVGGALQSLGTNYTLAGPSTVSGYPGYVIQWITSPSGVITANYTYFYRCCFSDKTFDPEQFVQYLWLLSSLKFEQVPV